MIVDNCIENAKALFKELEGEFYPFGYVIKNDASAMPYYVDIDVEFPDGNEVIKQLATSLASEIKKGKYIQGAVCSLNRKEMEGVTFEFLDIKTLDFKGDAKDYVALISPDYINYTFEVIDISDYIGTINAYNLNN